MNENQIIKLCELISNLSRSSIQVNTHEHYCFCMYLKELADAYDKDIDLVFDDLIRFETNISMTYLWSDIWCMPGLAYVYLALYNKHTFVKHNGVSPFDIMYRKILNSKGNYEIVPHPAYAILLEHKSMQIWIKWMYALVYLKDLHLNNNNVKSSVFNSINNELELKDRDMNNINNINNINFIQALVQCFNAPSYDKSN